MANACDFLGSLLHICVLIFFFSSDRFVGYKEGMHAVLSNSESVKVTKITSTSNFENEF